MKSLMALTALISIVIGNLASALPPAGDLVEVGDVVSHQFSEPTLNGMGLASLESLRGKPALVEFWGHRCPPCVNSAVPDSVALAGEFGEELTVLLVESQGASLDEVEALAYSRKWMGRPAIWTTERPFRTGARGLPNFVLLSCDGEVLLKGNPISMKAQIEETIKKEIKLSKKAPDGVPRSLKKAWTDFARGKYASALSAARKVADSTGPDAEAAASAVEVFSGRLFAKVARLNWMVDNGYLVEAEDFAEELSKQFRGLEQFDSQVKEISKKLASPAMKNEMAAAKTFAKLEKKVSAEGLEGAALRQLAKFAEKKAGTKAADRARRLAALAN